jgi:hypothetical protein
VWLVREVRAQVTRFGLSLGVLSAALIVAGTGLPMIDAPLRSARSDSFGLDNALIAHLEGWLFVGFAAALALVLFGYRYAGPLRPLLALAVIGLGSATQWAVTRVAEGDLLDPCRLMANLCGPPDQLDAVRNWSSGYGFLVIELGAAAAVIAGFLLLVPAASPRRRRRRFAGREVVVWL